MTKFTCPTCQHDRFILSMHEKLVHVTLPRKTLPSIIKWNSFTKNTGHTFLMARCSKCGLSWVAEYPIDNLKEVMEKEGVLK